MFTVKQISRLAGITPRALHYYDQIGLLQPTRVGDNGYRYYDEQALLRLQQILLYRELGMPLDHIRQILARPNFDVSRALESHRAELSKRAARLSVLIATVNQTLEHLKGNQPMSKQQLFEGFSDEQQAEYEKEILQKYDPATVKSSIKKWNAYSAEEKQRIGEDGNAAYQALLSAMPAGPASPAAQAAVALWRRQIEYFWVPDDDQVLGLAQGYLSDPRFKANFDKIHPQLAEFLLEAVKVYLDRKSK